eukprot:4043345-Prymnesium_polylepis.1
MREETWAPTQEGCRDWFTTLSAKHGLRHPAEVFHSGPAPSFNRGHASYAPVARSNCEVLVLLHNGTLWVKPSRLMRHPVKLALLNLLVSSLPIEAAFLAGLSTGDLHLCAQDAPQVGTLADGLLVRPAFDKRECAHTSCVHCDCHSTHSHTPKPARQPTLDRPPCAVAHACGLNWLSIGCARLLAAAAG